MRQGASVVASARPRDDHRNASIDAYRDRIARFMRNPRDPSSSWGVMHETVSA